MSEDVKANVDENIAPAQINGKKPEVAEEESIGEIIKTVVFALGIALILRVFVFQPFSIPSESMRPGLIVGDYLIVSKWDYGFSRASVPFGFAGKKAAVGSKQSTDRLLGRPIERGEVVVFKHPVNHTDYIKRTIGLPGDRVQVIGGQIVINGIPVQREGLSAEAILDSDGKSFYSGRWKETLPNGKSYIVYDFSPMAPLDNTETFEVPPGHYFMMGDNRDNSTDSRVAQSDMGVGFVPAENIVGKGRTVLLSWKADVRWYKPWTWLTQLRWDRLIEAIN